MFSFEGYTLLLILALDVLHRKPGINYHKYIAIFETISHFFPAAKLNDFLVIKSLDPDLQ
jgi:hypothetical protein